MTTERKDSAEKPAVLVLDNVTYGGGSSWNSSWNAHTIALNLPSEAHRICILKEQFDDKKKKKRMAVWDVHSDAFVKVRLWKDIDLVILANAYEIDQYDPPWGYLIKEDRMHPSWDQMQKLKNDLKAVSKEPQISADPSVSIPWLLTFQQVPVVFAARWDPVGTSRWYDVFSEKQLEAYDNFYKLVVTVKDMDFLRGRRVYLFLGGKESHIKKFNKATAKLLLQETRTGLKKSAREMLTPDYLYDGPMSIVDQYFGHRWDNNPLMLACAYKGKY